MDQDSPSDIIRSIEVWNKMWYTTGKKGVIPTVFHMVEVLGINFTQITEIWPRNIKVVLYRKIGMNGKILVHVWLTMYSTEIIQNIDL